MPLLLRETATAWGDIGLKNNDVQLEVVTPASAHEVKSYKTQREYDAAAREFSNRTDVPWDAFIYYVDPAYRNEPSYIEAAKSYYHIHMFATLMLGKCLRIDRLLPKSGHDKGDYRVNLAEHPLAQWDSLVATMSSRTRIAVERFKVHYVERFLLLQQE
jgi:hypothetical protein